MQLHISRRFWGFNQTRVQGKWKTEPYRSQRLNDKQNVSTCMTSVFIRFLLTT